MLLLRWDNALVCRRFTRDKPALMKAPAEEVLRGCGRCGRG